MSRREAYSSTEIDVIRQAVEIVLRDVETTGSAPVKLREEIGSKAFRVESEQGAIELDDLVAILRVVADSMKAAA